MALSRGIIINKEKLMKIKIIQDYEAGKVVK